MPALTTLPNCLLIGAAKAGTTLIWDALRQHPAIFMPERKQLNFFSYKEVHDAKGPISIDRAIRPVTSLDEYKTQFAPGRDATIRGEASTSYLVSLTASTEILSLIPEVKLIASLRDPSERAYSRYLQLVRDGRERLPSFRAALDQEAVRTKENWSPEYRYVDGGLYYKHLSKFVRKFSREQMKIVFFEDIRANPPDVFAELYGFLGVDTSVSPTVERYSASGLPRSRALGLALHSLKRFRSASHTLLRPSIRAKLARAVRQIDSSNLVRPPLDPSIRADLIGAFREDTLRLQDLVGRDLSAWLR